MIEIFAAKIYFTPSTLVASRLHSLFREDWLEIGNDFDHSILSKITDCQNVSPLEKSLSRCVAREQGGCEN